MSQFSGYGRRGGGEDDEDDVRRVPPPTDPGRPPGAGGPERQFTYYTEERYWTDYLRIAVPVLGVILILALVWIWINSFLSDSDNASPTPSTGDNPVVITGGTPTAEGEGVGTPRPLQTPQATSPAGTSTAGGEIAPGATVVVANTGGTGVNLRDEPSTSGAVLATLPDGTELEVTGEAVEAEDYTWWPVKTDEFSGYVVAEFIEPSQ